MDDEDRDRLHIEFLDTLLFPPRLIACGQRLRDARFVTVVSHVERWPWRTVISGTRSAIAGMETRAVGGPHRLGWVSGWTLDDDVGTEYRLTGASEGGDESCIDFRVRFNGVVPDQASRLAIGFPSGRRVEVEING